jgi:hypothetical protein
MFARGAVRCSKPNGLDATSFTLEGRFSEIRPLWTALARIDALIVNLPMVAWKRTFLTPALALFLARTRGVRAIVVLHEWADLNWRRRFVLGFCLVFAQTILFSSPHVRSQFARGLLGWAPFATGLAPIPANIARPPRPIRTALGERLAAEKARGKLILGHFGSIYPKKQSTFVLDVVAELRRMRRDVFVVFVGGFVTDGGDVETEFQARVSALSLKDDVLVTGYIHTDAEIYAIFELVDVFVYCFAEGLTSRRGSILACLQSGRPLVVNGPKDPGEFDHHRSFQKAMTSPAMHLVPNSSKPEVFAAAINAMDLTRAPEPISLFEESWRDAALAIGNAISARANSQSMAPIISREPMR